MENNSTEYNQLLCDISFVSAKLFWRMLTTTCICIWNQSLVFKQRLLSPYNYLASYWHTIHCLFFTINCWHKWFCYDFYHTIEQLYNMITFSKILTKGTGDLFCHQLGRDMECLRRVHFVYAPSQWEITLHCNVVSNWLGAYTKWSLAPCIIMFW